MPNTYPSLTDIHVRVIDGRVKNGDGLRAAYQRWFDELAPEGWLSATSGVTDGGDFVAVQRFTSAESARRSRQTPAYEEWLSELGGYLAEMRVRESSGVATFGEARPPEAGFVQFLQGRAAKAMPDILERVGEHEQHHIREHDLPVLGGLVIHHDDDHFTEVIYYPSEDAAQNGPGQAVREEAASMMERLGDAVGGIDYRQLRDPWIHHH